MHKMELGFLQETKSILKSLVLSCPNGMTIDRLNRDYKEVVGSWIPYLKLGFPNLELFLRSVPDTLVVIGHGREARIGFVSNDKLQHMNEMVSRQKNTTRERKVAVLHASSQKSRHQIVRQPNNNVAMFQSTSSTTYCTFSRRPEINNNDLYSNPPPSSSCQSKNYFLERNLPRGKPQNNHFVPTTNTESKKTLELKSFKQLDEVFNKQHKYTNFDKQSNTRKVLDEPSGTKALFIGNSNSIQMLYEPMRSRVFVDKDSADCTTGQLENSMSLIDCQNNLKCVSDKSISEVAEEIKYPIVLKLNSSKSRSRSSIDEKILSNRRSNEQVNFNTNNVPGISSKTESFERISKPADLPLAPQSINSSFINNIQFKADPFSQIDSSDNDIDEAVPEFAANNLVFRVDFPENTVAFGRKIPNYELPKELTKGYVVGVFISEIHSPFKFWFHIYKDNHELDILMNRIECFYKRLSHNDLVIPKSCLAPGQVCGAMFNEMWHRAEILTIVCNNKVKVYFVDYGTVSEIEIKNIKYLPTIFANTPMQAIRGSLSHIKPVSPLWPKRAIKEFLSMVSEILLYAQIIEIDEKEKTVYMVLCDTNNGETLQINKQLVDRGFAKLDSEWDENKITKNGYRKRHPREIFPTFEMLETGEYPSLFELEKLLAQGIDYEKITEKIILFNLNSNVCDNPLLKEDCSTRNNTFSFNLLDTNPFKSDIISEIVSLKIFDD